MASMPPTWVGASGFMRAWAAVGFNLMFLLLPEGAKVLMLFPVCSSDCLTVPGKVAGPLRGR